MKTILITLAFVAAICASGIAGDGAATGKRKPIAGLEKAVLSEDWTQCAGRFHYTFRPDHSFQIDGTLLSGTWKTEADELILTWSRNWIVDHVKFDAAKQVFHSARGEDFDIRGAEVTGRLALAAE